MSLDVAPELAVGSVSNLATGSMDRVLDAAKTCMERFGFAKTTVDDIASEAGISRATLYRLFPGGKDVLCDALRRRETANFFASLEEHVADATTLEDLVVSIVVEATNQLRADQHLQVMLATQPGEALKALTFDDLPLIFQVATAYLMPRVAPFIGEDSAAEMAEWLARVVLSYFLTPSRFVDLGDAASASRFVRNFVLPAFPSPVPTER
jgi:AcrR family transcriptional regulator